MSGVRAPVLPAVTARPSIGDMRRSRSLLLAATAGLALFASACGVTADTTAATVAGTAIPVDDVTTLVSDPVFNGGAEQPNESSQDGTLARSALMFLIERQAWLSELDRWGLEISDADREQIGAQIDEQAAAGGQALDGRSRELLVEYTAAQSVLTERFSSIDPERDDDLRRLYESSELQWRQVCLTVVQVPADQIAAAEDRLDDGLAVQDLAEVITGAEVVAEPSQGCFAQVGLAPELRADLEVATVGATRGVVLTDDGSGGVAAYAYRLEERRNLSFEEARGELAAAAEGLLQQGPAQWVQLAALGAEVNPRYGQEVVSTADGFTVQAPPRPQLPRGQRIADAVVAARAAAEAATAQAAAGQAPGGQDPTAQDPTAQDPAAAGADGSTAGG
jgi:hypothetical protein